MKYLVLATLIAVASMTNPVAAAQHHRSHYHHSYVQYHEFDPFHQTPQPRHHRRCH